MSFQVMYMLGNICVNLFCLIQIKQEQLTLTLYWSQLRQKQQQYLYPT